MQAQRTPWVLLAAALIVSSCGGGSAPAPPPPKVKVVQPVAREIIEWDEYTARLDAVDSVEVRPRVSGYLQSSALPGRRDRQEGRLPLSRSTRVRTRRCCAGPRRISRSRRHGSRWRRRTSRAPRTLLASHAISQEEADTRESLAARRREASVEEAQAAVEAAKLDVEFTTVSAPITGRIARKLVTEGNLINGGVGHPEHAAHDDRVARPDLRLLRGRRGVGPQVRAPRPRRTTTELARAPQPGARRHSPTRKGFRAKACMDFVDNQLDRGTGTMVARAMLPNPDLSLIPGLFARLRLPGSGKYRGDSPPRRGDRQRPVAEVRLRRRR